LEFEALMLLPFAFLFAFLCITDPKIIFIGFFLLIPFSIEVELPGGFGTDLPSEPMMLALTAITIGLILTKAKQLDAKHIYHPISILLILHLSWILFTSFFAVVPLYSFKFFLAKLWYVLPFYVLPFFIIKKPKDLRPLMHLFMIALFVSAVYVLFRHAAFYGLDFSKVNKACKPIYRNHVSYAAIMALALPYLWWLHQTASEGLKKTFYVLIGLFLLVAIYFTYTRAAYITVVAAIAAYYMVKYKLSTICIVIGIIGAAGFTFHSMHKANYLEYAPNYERTITHEKFGNLVEATYKLEDVSTMERLHRWVAGFQMIKEKPITGFGPSNFYFTYKDYTVNSFKTYVSDNPEKSGIHNNYLMVLVEQGIFGFIIMMLIAIVPILIGERKYHSTKNVNHKRIIMMAILSFIVIDLFLIINDIIEADKVGPFYFLNAAIIVLFGNDKKEEQDLD